MTRYAYNQQCVPPAPFVHVTVRHPPTGREIADIPAQLDTAADRTIVPQRVIEALGPAQSDVLRLRGFGGFTAEFPAYMVLLEIRQQQALSVKVVASREEDYVLLGRDVLNKFRIFLYGPELALEVG